MPIQVGYDKYTTFEVDGGSEVRIDVTGHSWKEQVDALDVSSTATAQLQALLAGIFRGDGNVKGFVNSAAYPWALGTGPDVRAGNTGTMRLRIGPGVLDWFVIPCLITALNTKTEHAGTVEFDFDIKFNVLADGTYTYPVAS